MVSRLALLSTLLLASVALALPSSRLGDRLARRRENRQSRLFNHVEAPVTALSNVEYGPNWAGAVWGEGNGTFTTVTGTFAIPTPSGSGSAAVWVGIDGYSCQNAILQTGVSFTISNGQVSYNAWYEWYPDVSNDFSGISLSAGDIIQATVTAYSATSGLVALENLNTGEIVQEDISSSYALCQQDAEWIIEDYYEDDQQVAFADFGGVTISSATASGPSGTVYTPSGATIVDIEQNGQVLTSVSTSGEDVSISYV